MLKPSHHSANSSAMKMLHGISAMRYNEVPAADQSDLLHHGRDLAHLIDGAGERQHDVQVLQPHLLADLLDGLKLSLNASR